MANAERKEMEKHLKDIVIPFLRKRDFKGSFPHFRRMGKERIHLLTFQFDFHGGGFVIEIANCVPGGFTTPWGKKIEPDKLRAHDVYKRSRIQSNMNTPDSSTDDWFRFDHAPLSGSENIFQDVCQDVLSKFNIAEEYWANGELNGSVN